MKQGYFDPADIRTLSTPELRAEALDALAQPGAVPDGVDEATRFEAFTSRFPAEVAAWTLRLPEGNDRDTKLASAIRNWAADEPLSAAAWVTEKLPPSQQPKAIATLLSGWKINDPDGAKAWFRTLPPETRQGITPPGKDW